MTLNPIVFTKQILDTFLRYQRTAFPFSDERLAKQARAALGESLESDLAKGPYVSLSRPFRLGAKVAAIVAEGLLHPAMKGILAYPDLFSHQEEALRAAKAGKNLIVSTGTGSGKTEAFLAPILDHCLALRDKGAEQGVVAVIVYPMNALAADQMDRLRRMLRGSGISYGMWVGNTPATDAAAELDRAPETLSGKELDTWLDNPKAKVRRVPQEERISEADLRARPPRLLLTNPQQLEMLLTRAKDQGLFSSGMLRYLVFDEAHTYEGVTGAEVAVLIRRLKAFAGGDIQCIGTSATLSDPERGSEAAVRFAHRFFGIPAAQVAVVEERYVEVEWPQPGPLPALPEGDPLDVLEHLLAVVMAEAWDKIPDLDAEVARWLGHHLPTGQAPHEGLYGLLAPNPVVQAIAEVFAKPLDLKEGARLVAEKVGRPIQEDWNPVEVLAYLAMGVRAQKSGDPILRPKLHTFISGLDQAHVRFDDDGQPILHLANKEELQLKHPEWLASGIFPLSVCTACGQHAMATDLAGAVLEEGQLKNGQMEGENAVWAAEAQGVAGQAARTIYFTDQIAWKDEDGGDLVGTLSKYLCRRCGSLHDAPSDHCLAPKCGVALPLFQVQVFTDDNRRCPACDARMRGFGRTTKPFKAVRAFQVADVHTLAQAMLTHAPKAHRKLLVFADSRQDAAFQAGWSEDHGRRHRFRQVMFQEIRKDPGLSFGALHARLVERLLEDRYLRQVIAPEVSAYLVGNTDTDAGRKELARFLRHRLMMETATAFTSRHGLEAYGLLRIGYPELDRHPSEMEALAQELGWDAQEFKAFLALLLDTWRRNQILSDNEGGADTFTRIWRQGAKEVTRGYIPEFMRPKVLVERRSKGDGEGTWQTALVSRTGRTFAQGLLAKVGPNVSPTDRNAFLKKVLDFLVDLNVLEHVVLRGSGQKATPLSGGAGYSLRADGLAFLEADTRWRCQKCRKPSSSPSPGDRCPRHNCDGLLKVVELDLDHFDVALLTQEDFEPVVPKEHSAQVPPGERARIEREFKRADGDINCLVATPTLEMGVDIGALDMVLMRNMPPGSSNYWQRAGRAGRRERMASILTYCRRWHHDQYFFARPLDLLRGEIQAPRFNLHNPILVAKHVHAIAVGMLLRLEGADSAAIRNIFPPFIGGYIFVEDPDQERAALRPEALAVKPELDALVAKHRAALEEAILAAFAKEWPEADQEVATPDLLKALLDAAGAELQVAVNRLYRRARWAFEQRGKLAAIQSQGQELTEAEQHRHRRLSALIRALRNQTQDTYTLSVLAQEGFLPGYGMTQGGCRFTFHGADSKTASRDLALGRGLAQAIREFVPGNLLYAIGEKFKVVTYCLSPRPEDRESEGFQVGTDPAAPFLRTPGQGGLLGVGGALIPKDVLAIPITDGTLDHASRITDDETNRFQLSVDVRASQLEHQHNGGTAYTTGAGHSLQHLRQQKLRLVNLGPASLTAQDVYGFPICASCGAARSPLASTTEITTFLDDHRKTCGANSPGWKALYADVRVDGLHLRGLQSIKDAANLAEALLLGAREILDMGERDLTWVPIAQDDGSWECFLYDPMPGGSGVLDEILDRWKEVQDRACHQLAHCPEACQTACYECLKNYPNTFHHPHLDRHRALELLGQWQDLEVQNPIPPSSGDSPTQGEVHHAPEQLFFLALQEAGLVYSDGPELNVPVALGDGMPTTYPDALYRSKKVAVYLDGLSKGLHGSPATKDIDALITGVLRMQGWKVHRIPFTALSDPAMKQHHFMALAQHLG